MKDWTQDSHVTYTFQSIRHWWVISRFVSLPLILLIFLVEDVFVFAIS